MTSGKKFRAPDWVWGEAVRGNEVSRAHGLSSLGFVVQRPSDPMGQLGLSQHRQSEARRAKPPMSLGRVAKKLMNVSMQHVPTKAGFAAAGVCSLSIVHLCCSRSIPRLSRRCLDSLQQTTMLIAPLEILARKVSVFCALSVLYSRVSDLPRCLASAYSRLRKCLSAWTPNMSLTNTLKQHLDGREGAGGGEGPGCLSPTCL